MIDESLISSYRSNRSSIGLASKREPTTVRSDQRPSFEAYPLCSKNPAKPLSALLNSQRTPSVYNGCGTQSLPTPTLNLQLVVYLR